MAPAKPFRATTTAPEAAATVKLMQIGQVAERTGLSLRTIRFYEENGLVVPAARSEGGFRLYGQDEVDRLEMIKRMKPLGFTLDEMHELLNVLDSLSLASDNRGPFLDRLVMFREAINARVDALAEQLAIAKGFAAILTEHITAERPG